MGSADATRAHQEDVYQLMKWCAFELSARAGAHDASKLEEPELSVFDEYTPKLKNTTYGSDEYKQYLAEMKVALDHHYANNQHHPEHFENGVNDMTLIDLIEMFCDWLAATKRHDDGDINRSININAVRFQLSEQLAGILRNTAALFESKKVE